MALLHFMKKCPKFRDWNTLKYEYLHGSSNISWLFQDQETRPYSLKMRHELYGRNPKTVRQTIQINLGFFGGFVPQDIKNCSSYGYLKYFWKTLVSCCLAALLILAFNLFEVYTIIRFYFCRQFSLSFLCGKWYSFDVNILNTKRKLNVHRTLRRRLGRLLYIQFISCVQGKYDLVTTQKMKFSIKDFSSKCD